MTELVSTANGIPIHLAQAKPRRHNLKFLVAGAVLLGLVIFLIVQATMTTGAYFMTVSEVQAAAPELIGRRVRVNGAVVENSEDWSPEAITLKFAIDDEDGSQLPIVFYGPRPDNFQRAASAIVEGELQPDGTFLADTLLLKCPSRYEEEPQEIFVQATR